MNGIPRPNLMRRLGFLVVLFLSIAPLCANPISDTPDIFENLVFVPIGLAILLEVICVMLVLKRYRHPRLFILWLLGMHVFTYPLFLAFLWLAFGLHPAMAAFLSEGAIVLVEGGLIYLMCRFLPAKNSGSTTPAIARTLTASLIGNICSAIAYPLLMMLIGVILSRFSEID